MERQTYSERTYQNKLSFNYYNFCDELRSVLCRIVIENLPGTLHKHLLEAVHKRARGAFTGDAFRVFADMERFFHKAPSIYLLDGVEIFVGMLFDDCDRKEREIKPIIDAINRAFGDFNAGFYVLGRALLQQESRYYDVRVIRQVYELLFAPGFEEALVNFQHALGWLRHDPTDFKAIGYYAEEALRQTVVELLRRHVNLAMIDKMDLHQALAAFARIPALPATCVAVLETVAESFRKIMAACESARSLSYDDMPECLPRFALNVLAAGLIMIMQAERELLQTSRGGGDGKIKLF